MFTKSDKIDLLILAAAMVVAGAGLVFYVIQSFAAWWVATTAAQLFNV